MTTTPIEQQVQKLHAAGYSIRGIASELDLDKSKVQRIIQKLKETSDTDHSPHGELLAGVTDTSVFPGYNPPQDTSNTEAFPFDTPIETDPISKSAAYLPILAAETIGNPNKPTGKAQLIREIKQMMHRTFHYKQECNEFVSKMITLHNGMDYEDITKYRGHDRKALRLIETGKVLAQDLEEDPNSLLIIHVLQSIRDTIQAILLGIDKVRMANNYIFLEGRRRTLPTWHETLTEDFLTFK